MSTTIQIPAHINKQLSSHANTRLPYECCGILVGKMSSSNQGITLVKEIWPVTNVETQNKNRFFNMSVADIHNVVKACREKFLDVIGFYHSHPFGIASPSQQDIEMATAWPGYYHLIIAPQRDQSQELNAFITAKPVWKKTKII